MQKYQPLTMHLNPYSVLKYCEKFNHNNSVRLLLLDNLIELPSIEIQQIPAIDLVVKLGNCYCYLECSKSECIYSV